MALLVLIGNVLARFLLLPGDLACDALGVGQAENRGLVRMLVNSLVWMVFSVVVVAIVE